MDKELKAIEGKDGVFAIMQTSKGSIVLELFYDKSHNLMMFLLL